MDASHTPHPADILPKAIYRQLAHTIRTHLPPLATDSPEDAARREHAAIEHAASLLPATREQGLMGGLRLIAMMFGYRWLPPGAGD